jgi:phosphoribosyl-AMP cyclohydrolase / phosphoribosyl-ATP pyrophosphohydrolase
MIDIESIDFTKTGGLIPAVVQDAGTGQVLMHGYMNRDALEVTIRNKRVTFWSRSRQHLWQKGETSGNILNLVSIYTDCDNDTLLVKAVPAGPVCHTGAPTCFHDDDPPPSGPVLDMLESIIRDRKRTMPEKSYTAKLFKDGTEKIAQKVGEEAVETVIAALGRQDDRVRSEAADLLYHLLVLLADREIRLGEVMDELRKRM